MATATVKTAYAGPGTAGSFEVIRAEALFASTLQASDLSAGEDVAAIANSAAMSDVIADRLRPGPDETQRCAPDITTSPLTFNDWARGAAVVGIQNVLGAL